MSYTRKRRRRPYYGRIALLVIVILAVLGGIVWGVSSCMAREVLPPEEPSSEESSGEEPSSLPEPAPEPSSQPEEIDPAHAAFLEANPAWVDFRMPPGFDYNLILVNKENVLPGELPNIADGLASIGDFQFNNQALPALERMLADAKASGLPLAIVSAYRPLSRSAALYKSKTQQYIDAGYSAGEAAVEAAKWVAPPGTSEHATGLAADIVSADYYTKMSDLEQSFEEFPEAKWMLEHCAEYGFILRFPKGKEEITQVNYEPWHFRYVGTEHAAVIMAEGLTLEEYLERDIAPKKE